MIGVSISGKAGAGKNFFSEYLRGILTEKGRWTIEVSFAEALKRELFDEYGLTKNDPGGREKLIEIGHGRRLAQPDYWVERLADRVESLLPYGILPVITDTRYANELRWAKQAGFLTVRVDATAMERGLVLHHRGEDASFIYSDHPSETDLDEESFDVRFANNHFSIVPLDEAARLVAGLLTGEVERIA